MLNRLSKKELAFIVKASAAVFITYLSMYAFRKPFTAAQFQNKILWGVDYKILLIIAQLIGYTISKYFGIKIVSELSASKRTITLISLMAFSWISLLFFAIVPFPYNLAFMFLNGLTTVSSFCTFQKCASFDKRNSRKLFRHQSDLDSMIISISASHVVLISVSAFRRTRSS